MKSQESSFFAPVCHSVHMEVSVQGGLCPGRSLFGGGGASFQGVALSRGVSVQECSLSMRGLCPAEVFVWGSLSRGCLCQVGSLSRRSLSMVFLCLGAFSVQGGLFPGSLCPGGFIKGCLWLGVGLCRGYPPYGDMQAVPSLECMLVGFFHISFTQ